MSFLIITVCYRYKNRTNFSKKRAFSFALKPFARLHLKASRNCRKIIFGRVAQLDRGQVKTRYPASFSDQYSGAGTLSFW